MNEATQSPRDKAIAIFRELVGDRANQLSDAVSEAQRIARTALAEDFDAQTAEDIAFHMTDWNSDAAFITAFLLFPDRFTAEEIRQGILDFLIHAPNHLAAAAKQHDCPIQDTFEVGALNGWPEDNETERA